MKLFWRIFYVLNGVAIVIFLATFAWAAFDLHDRFPFVLLAQVPPLVMMGIRRVAR